MAQTFTFTINRAFMFNDATWKPGDEAALTLVADDAAIQKLAADGFIVIDQPSGLPTGVVLEVGDLSIGSVELKDATTDTRVKIAASTAVTEAHNAVAVKDATIGLTTDAVVDTDAAGTLSAKLRGVVKLLASFVTAGVKLLAGENIIGRVVGYTQRVVGVVFQRPNNATPYAANDVVSTTGGVAIEFTVARANAGSGMVLSAGVDVASNPAIQPSLTLLLFATAPTAIADNATLALSDADAAKCIGVYPLTSVQIMNTGADAAGFTRFASEVIPRMFTCGAGSQKIFGLLVITAAHTPVAQIDYTAFVHIAE